MRCTISWLTLVGVTVRNSIVNLSKKKKGIFWGWWNWSSFLNSYMWDEWIAVHIFCWQEVLSLVEYSIIILQYLQDYSESGLLLGGGCLVPVFATSLNTSYGQPAKTYWNNPPSTTIVYKYIWWWINNIVTFSIGNQLLRITRKWAIIVFATDLKV